MNKIISGGGGSGGNNMDSINAKPPKVTVSSGQTSPSQASPVKQANGLNLLNLKQKSRPKKILKRILLAIGAVIIILGGALVLRAANLSQKIFVGQKTTFFGQIVDMIRGGGDNQTLQGENLGQINILLLGIGGEGHDGPYLTDTMILAQIRPDLNEITLTSIPRDYWINLPDGGQGKINEAFSDGYTKNYDWNQAGQSAIEAVQNLTGLQIPYFAVMDFSGFEQAINQVGGVDVTVDRTFTDYEYPDSGTGYLPPITFTAGPQHMDGTTALEFARSRHAAGIEGSDFARSQRQQKIIEAFKQKVITNNLISDASNLNSLLGIFADHFHTNMSPAEMYSGYSLAKNMTILSLSLDPDTHLICPEILASNGAYVLTPCPGESEADIQNFFKNSFSVGKLEAEDSTVWLANSTGNQAVYDTAFRKLTDAGLNVYQLDYSKDNLAQTIVYQVNPKPATTEFIENTLNATEVSLPPPDVTVNKDKVDVIVVLGQNAPNEAAPPPYVAPAARSNAATTTGDDATSTPSATSTPTN